MKTRILPLGAILFICCTIFFVACKKDISNPNPVIVPEEPNNFAIPAASPVTGSVSGLVVDENNNPVPSADVTFGTTVYQTDARGFFNINNVQLDKYVTTVSVQKTGYFKALRAFSASATRNYVSIKLIPKTLSGTISATAGGAINLTGGTGITFQANGMIVKSTGAAYTGQVNVYASYIDPTATDFDNRIPGSMMGQDTENMYVLQSTGMVAVDLESSTGEALQLANGKPAAVKLPIPASLLAKAPATIDTWSLDNRGVWIKEGEATRNGNAYELTASHFSFWNCDVPASAVYLHLYIQNQVNHPLPNTQVKLTIPNNNTWWATTYGYTDSSGHVGGLVPANLGLVMNVTSNVYNCPTPVFTQNIGPFSTDTTLHVTINLPTSNQVTVTGTVEECNNQPLASGTVIVYSGQYGMYYSTVSNGIYTVTFPTCSSTGSVSVTVIDSSTNVMVSSANIPITSATVTVPLLTVCLNSTPSVYNFTNCQPSGAFFVGVPVTQNNYILCTVDVISIGTYSITTPVTNGISYSGTGIFTSTGSQTFFLQATGIPLNSGSFIIFIPGISGQQGCSTGMTTINASSIADFTVSCSNSILYGPFNANSLANSNNAIELPVNVTTTGSYYITTNYVNGFYFRDTGTFNTTGVQNVILQAYGRPQQQGNFVFTNQYNGINGCSFNVDVGPPRANYTFYGAPGYCQYTVGGSYTTGVPLTANNVVELNVNVTTPGIYEISTNTRDGFRFSGTGLFTSTGPQSVFLTGTGTPISAGTYIFVPNVACDFSIQVN